MLHQDIDAREKFLFTLEWLLGLQARYPEHMGFGLIHVEFQDPSHLGETYGVHEAMKMLVGLTHALRHAFRSTDLVARDGMGVWILAPFTSPETVISKAAEIVRVGAENGLNIVEHYIRIYSLPEDGAALQGRDPASNFLETLRASGLGRTVASFAAAN
jgi:hypothetical protein